LIYDTEVLFGNSLESYAIDHGRTVPLVVLRCCEAIENTGGLQKEGIYRVSGRQSNVEQLKHLFELDEEKAILDGFDVVTIATVLKTYLRELKRPLFDFNVQSRAAYDSKCGFYYLYILRTNHDSRIHATNPTISVIGVKTC
jgi:hypothetical protein